MWWKSLFCLAVYASAEAQPDDACLLQTGRWETAIDPVPGADEMAGEEEPRDDGIVHEKNWGLFELVSYSVKKSWDWWSDSDVYAEITVQPTGRTYQTEVFHDSNSGVFNFAVFTPPAMESLEIRLFNHNGVMVHDLIGTGMFYPQAECITDPTCPILVSVRGKNEKEEAQIHAIYAREAKAMKEALTKLLNQDATIQH